MKIYQFTLVSFLIIAGILPGCKQETNKQLLEKPPFVTVAKAGMEDTFQTVTYSGSIVPDNITDISFAVSGTINKVAVNEGQQVSKGQFLASIDATEYEAALQIAHASLNQTEDAFRRFDELYKKGSFPEKDYIEIKTKVAQAKATKKINAKRVADSRLLAPSNGIVAAKLAEAGGTAAPGVPAFTIVKTDLVYAMFTVPESEIGNFNSGMEVEVNVPTLNRSFTGKIAVINPVADEKTKTFTLKVRLHNKAGVLMPGMIAEVMTGVPTPVRNIKVPLTAIVNDGNNVPHIYVLAGNNSAELKRIVVGQISGDDIEVTQGLDEDETIIVAGHAHIRDGQPVTIETRTSGAGGHKAD